MLFLGVGVEIISYVIVNMFYFFLYDDKLLYSELRNNRELVLKVVEEMFWYWFYIFRWDCMVK